MRLIRASIVTASVLTLVDLIASTPAHAATAARCTELTKLKIAASEIGLPSGGAAITSAQMATVPADPTTPGATREFCKVLGAIAPVDPNAPPVNFQVNLPLQWNGKAVQYGGGGFNGELIAGVAALRDSRRDIPVPIARGFATWGTDSGHDETMLPEFQAFALNDEALINFGYAAYKKTRDVSRHIAMVFYERAPSHIYYFGGSSGGREGLTMAQRFPSDYDGIVSVVPGINFTSLMLAGNRAGIVQQNGGWLSPAKVATLHKGVVAACDMLDGLADGVIGAYERCLGTFDPKVMRCAGGIDSGDTCLSDPQLAAVETLHQPLLLGFEVANGVNSYPPLNYGGENQQAGMVTSQTGRLPPQFPLPAQAPTPAQDTQSLLWRYGNGFVRYFIARDPTFDPLRFRPQDFVGRIREISALLDSTNPDLSAYLARGGKLILKTNGADYTITPFLAANYYKSVIARMGQERVDSFLRFYVTPGANHLGNGLDSSGAAIPAALDLLGELDAWVNGGSAPDTLVQVSQDAMPPFKILSSRPMCRYPLYPRYNGRGDPKQASSFTCTPQ
jgi:Tannase and feruloyl esterase